MPEVCYEASLCTVQLDIRTLEKFEDGFQRMAAHCRDKDAAPARTR